MSEGKWFESRGKRVRMEVRTEGKRRGVMGRGRTG